MNKQDDIGRLIKDVGTRQAADPEQFEAAYARVNKHWQQVVSEQGSQKRAVKMPWIAIAATVLLAVTIGLLYPRTESPITEVSIASVNRIVGDVLIDGSPAAEGAVISHQSQIVTRENSFIALDLASGQSLRIDQHTALVARSQSQFELRAGRIYVDSGADSRSAPVFIETHLGTATDVGTQFQVRVAPTSLLIGVREGLVALNEESGRATEIPLGTLFELSTGGESVTQEIATDDEVWNWTASIVPNFDTDGATLADYLAWFARERGLRLAWHDEMSQSNAGHVVLDGSIDGLTLDEGLAAVGKIAPFDYAIVDNVMTVKVQ